MMIRAYQRWIQHQDEKLLRASITVGSWFIAFATILLLLILLTQVPLIGSFTGLTLIPPLLCFLPAFILGMIASIWKDRLSVGHLASFTIGTSACIFFFVRLL